MSECANTGRWAPQSARTGSVCEERRGSQAGTSAPWEEWGPAERGPRVGGRVWVTEVGNLEVPSQTSRSPRSPWRSRPPRPVLVSVGGGDSSAIPRRPTGHRAALRTRDVALESLTAS
ncbi:uncharacterized protein RHO17_012982 isoform 1-T1 [Thomomys bottae]